MRFNLMVLELLFDIKHQGDRIMSAISDFSDKMKVHNDKTELAITGLQTDVGVMKDLIAQLQASAGKITAEDQALLDQIEARASTVADKLEALDALTPPVPPSA